VGTYTVSPSQTVSSTTLTQTLSSTSYSYVIKASNSSSGASLNNPVQLNDITSSSYPSGTTAIILLPPTVGTGPGTSGAFVNGQRIIKTGLVNLKMF
jgi:PKD repeat protein